MRFINVLFRKVHRISYIECRRYINTGTLTVKSRSTQVNSGQLTVHSRSDHDQLTVRSRSTHGQVTINSRSDHCQLTVRSRSTQVRSRSTQVRENILFTYFLPHKTHFFLKKKPKKSQCSLQWKVKLPTKSYLLIMMRKTRQIYIHNKSHSMGRSTAGWYSWNAYLTQKYYDYRQISND